jgi:hypothetical protein
MSFPASWLLVIEESGIPLQTISLQMGWRKQRLHQLVKPNRTYRLREDEYKKLLPLIIELEDQNDKKKSTLD